MGLFLAAVSNEGYKSLTFVDKIETRRKGRKIDGRERARERGMASKRRAERDVERGDCR